MYTLMYESFISYNQKFIIRQVQLHLEQFFLSIVSICY